MVQYQVAGGKKNHTTGRRKGWLVIAAMPVVVMMEPKYGYVGVWVCECVYMCVYGCVWMICVRRYNLYI